MPNRPWRKCSTCEWSDDDGAPLTCHLKNSYQHPVEPNDWCSEWKSSKPETCGMCQWFSGDKDAIEHGLCHLSVHSLGQSLWPKTIANAGACRDFRRK